MWIDILGSDGEPVGPGPITTATSFRYTHRLGRAGEWELRVPATEPRLALATLKRELHCYTYINGQKRWMGGGELEQRSVALSGVPEMVLTGNDPLYELARIPIRLEINYDSPYIGNGIWQHMLTFAPAGWAITIEGNTPQVILRFAGESLLNCLITLAQKTGKLFTLAPTSAGVFRHILITSAVQISGVVATNQAAPLAIERNVAACLIDKIERRENAWSLINRGIAFGAGSGEARFTPYAATQWPNGASINSTYSVTDLSGRGHRFILNKGENSITDLDSVAAYGDAYASQVQFKEIAPISNNAGDTIAAANTLVGATVEWLMDTSVPQDHYTVAVHGLRRLLRPGQSVRVQAKEVRDGQAPIDINADLIIQEIITQVDENGATPVSLTVSTSREFAQTDAQVIARQIAQSIAFQAHPQMGPSENTISYREDIDDDYGGSFPFWLSRGTTQLSSVVVRFKLDRLRSTVKSVGGTASGTVDIPDHSHSVSVPSHDHDIPDHQHRIAIANSASGGAVTIVSVGPDQFLATSGGGEIFTNDDSGSTTSQSGGGATVTSSNGGGSSGLALDLANAISAVYGIYEDPGQPYAFSDLTWTINGLTLTTPPRPIIGGWYEFDATSYLIDNATLRPTTAANTVAVNVSNKADLQVRVTVQIEIRSIIQSIAVV